MPVSRLSLNSNQADRAEYDLVSSDVKTKDWYYTEAAANLNGADEALQNVSAGLLDEEPVSLAMGKSGSTYPLLGSQANL